MTVIAPIQHREKSTIPLPASAKASILLILLITDTPQANISAKHGEYPEIFTSFFENSINSINSIDNFEGNELSSDHSMVIESFDVVSGFYPEDSLVKKANGILITGSEASAYERIPWITKLIDYVSKLSILAPRLKIVGICFGHQIVAIAFGGKCEKNVVGGWEVGSREIILSKVGQKVFGADSISMQQVHQDHVIAPPTDFYSIGGTFICPLHGLIKFSPLNPAKIQILTFQGHPEFNTEIIEGIIDNLVDSYEKTNGAHGFNVDETSKILATKGHDGFKLGRIMLGMFGLE